MVHHLQILSIAAFAAWSPLLSWSAHAVSGSGIEDPSDDDRFYCRERKLGTWFYCSKPKPPERAPKTTPSPAPPSQSATERMEAVTAKLRELKALAILEPTEENVTAYIRFQREQLDRASLFGDVWQRAIWQTPELDYTLQRPVGTVAKRAWLDSRRSDRERALTTLSERYGLFYFFAQGCAACSVFSPILKSVADSHGIHVMAVSVDGGPSETFSRYVVDSGQRRRMGLTDNVTPAVVLFDTVTKRAIPVSHGILAADELMDRLYVLTQTEPGRDF